MRFARAADVSTASTRTSWQALVALYEHSVFTQGVGWGIDCFDQWRVELDKEQAMWIAAELAGPKEDLPRHDSSTRALILRYRQLREERP
jgi:glucose-6-phosphate isomerase